MTIRPSNYGRRNDEIGRKVWVLKEKDGKVAKIRGKEARFVTKKVAKDTQNAQKKLFRELDLVRIDLSEGKK